MNSLIIQQKKRFLFFFALFLSSLSILNASQTDSQSKGRELEWASYKGEIARVKELLKQKPDINHRDQSGGTALHAGTWQDNLEILEILLEYGFDIDAQGSFNKNTPLHDAVWGGNFKVVQFLIQHKANPNIKNREGLNPYQMALNSGKKEIASYLRKYTK